MQGWCGMQLGPADGSFVASLESQTWVRESLDTDESLVWIGKPNRKFSFNRADLFLLPMGLVALLGGLDWLIGLVETSHKIGRPMSTTALLWSIPPFAIAFYLLVVRLLVKYIRKRGTIYALSSKRAMTLRAKRQVVESYTFYKDIPSIEVVEKKDGSGNLHFGRLQLGASLFENAGMDFMVRANRLGSPATSFFEVSAVKDVGVLAEEALEQAKSDLGH